MWNVVFFNLLKNILVKTCRISCGHQVEIRNNLKYFGFLNVLTDMRIHLENLRKLYFRWKGRKLVALYNRITSFYEL